jgi:hypothetical protein
MKATIEFELPTNEEAYLDAVNGTKWRELASITDLVLMVWRDTEEDLVRRGVYDKIRKWFRSNIQNEGLTLATAATLRQSRSRQAKLWTKQLDDYLKKQGIPEMMAEFEMENSADDIHE